MNLHDDDVISSLVGFTNLYKSVQCARAFIIIFATEVYKIGVKSERECQTNSLLSHTLGMYSVNSVCKIEIFWHSSLIFFSPILYTAIECTNEGVNKSVHTHVKVCEADKGFNMRKHEFPYSKWHWHTLFVDVSFILV